MEIKIIMDSAGDIDTLHGTEFESVPLTIQAGDKVFVDDHTTDVSEMVGYLSNYKGKVTTACPSIGAFLDAFGEATHIFCVTITSKLSGSYDAAKIAAQTYIEQYPDRKVHVFDSLSAGPEMALIVEKIRELLHRKLPFDSVVKQVNEYKNNTRLMFALESLHNLANNGRISSAVAKLAGALNIRILGRASDKGQLQTIGKVRGEKKLISEIINSLIEMGYRGGKLRITHCFNETAAKELLSALREKFQNADITIAATRALCSFYAERGGLLIGFEV